MLNTIDCTFPRADLAAALGRLASVLPTRTTLPVLGYVRFSHLDGDSVRMEATDLDRRAETTATLSEPCEPFDPVCLPLAMLLAAAKAYSGVRGSLKARGDRVEFSSGASKIKLPTLPANEFPEMWLAEGDVFRDVGRGSASDLLGALSRVAFAAATEATAPALVGVSFGSNGKGLVAVATDRHQLAKEVVGWNAEFEPATIANAGVQALLRFFAASEDLTVQRSEQRFRFADETDSTLIVPTLDSPYPDFDQIIPRDNEITVRADRLALLGAVQRIRLIHRDGGIARTVVSVSKEGIALSAESEHGAADEFVAAEVEGPDLRIGFSSTYLLNVLGSLSGENVTVEMKAPERAAVWRSEGSDGLRLVMPLRLL